MKKNARKIQKRLGRICPECEEQNLVLTRHNKVVNGVTYSDEYYECLNCGYTELKKNKNRHNSKIDFIIEDD